MIEKPSTHGRRLLALALRIAPAERDGWFAAMAAEFDHAPGSARGRFALGCLLAAIRERVISPPFVNAAARGLLIGGAVFWAALNLRFSGRMSTAEALVPESLGYGTALIFTIGAFATARYGYRATIALAAPLMAVLALVAISLRIEALKRLCRTSPLRWLLKSWLFLPWQQRLPPSLPVKRRMRQGHL